MALSVISPTLLDLAKRLDPDGSIAPIVEILNQSAPILDDMAWKEGNLPTGNRGTIRTGLPTATWRKMYGGVLPGKSRTLQVTDNCGMLEAYAEVDKALADLNGNTTAFRASEDTAFIEGMTQEFVSTLLYGNESTEPEAFTGLAPRFNSLSAENACNIIGGGSNDTDNTSIWLVGWGDNTVHGIVPKGSKAGLQMSDLGEVTAGDRTNGYFQAYRTHYRWDCGLVVKDWRYVVRIPNIEVSDLLVAATSGADLTDLMAQAVEMIPNLGACRPVFYMNRTVRSMLRRQIAAKVASSTLTMDSVGGKMVMHFDEIPVKRLDGITNAETLVS